MKAKLPMRNVSLLLASTLFAMGLSACTSSSPTPTITAAGGADCVIIDTDFDIDDMMAIPPMIGTTNVVAVLVTEGYSRAPEGAAAAEVFLANTEPRLRPPVLQGASYAGQVDFTAMPWIPQIRASMERVNGLLSTTLQPSPATVSYTAALEKATGQCHSVDVVVIGAFTSFVTYSPVIGSKIAKVIMQGKPLMGDSTQPAGKISFNCEFDLPACEKAFTQLAKYDAVWVDVPRGTTPPYSPTAAMVSALKDVGLPGTLKAALNATPANWREDLLVNGNKSLLWDQSAALYLSHPQEFAKVGGHWETTLSPAAFQAQWTRDSNATVPPQ
jgi:inosine-uridine nucleoside N-ribohydrolase